MKNSPHPELDDEINASPDRIDAFRYARNEICRR
jgi:hypothetical protein